MPERSQKGAIQRQGDAVQAPLATMMVVRAVVAMSSLCPPIISARKEVACCFSEFAQGVHCSCARVTNIAARIMYDGTACPVRYV